MRYFNNVGGFIRDTFFDKKAVDRLNALGTGETCGMEPLSGEELTKKLNGAEVLFTGWGQKPIHIKDIPSVRLIVHTGGTVGGLIDNDVFEAGIPVLSGNRYYAESVAEGVIAYMLFALRNMGYNSSQMDQGIWAENKTRGLLNKKVGIVSLGAISKLVIGYLKYFKCEVLVYSTRHNEELSKELGFTYATLDEIFSTCDVVSVHTARTPQTLKMINAHHFSLLKEGAVFLNTARGEVLDEEALVEALKENRFVAVLDVFNQEPLPEDHPFVTLPNAILFPHQCGPTFDRRTFITNELITDVESFLNGEEMKNRISYETMLRMTH